MNQETGSPPVLQFLSVQHEQTLGPGHVELQVTRLLQTRRHEAQKLLHVDVGQRAADDRDWNKHRVQISQVRLSFAAEARGTAHSL